MQNDCKKLKSAIYAKIVTNAILCVLVFLIGLLCVVDVKGEVSVGGDENALYRCAGEDGAGVSLMFNVYSGTDEVYAILETLEKHGAKATFFIGGCWADDNVDCLRAIYSAGHEIGNHGYFHKDHSKMSVAENQKEIADCNRFVALAIGEKPTLFAPPSGAYSNDTLSACGLLSMTTVLWSKDTIDWRDQNSALIYTRATRNIAVGDFVLMHPTKATVGALHDVLTYYEKNNLKAVTVSTNLKGREK